MVDLMHLGAFSIIFMMILGFVSNQNPTALTQIGARFNELTCPLPLYDGVDQPFSNSTYNNQFGFGNITYGTGYGTQYKCLYDPLSAPPGTSIQTAIWQYNATSFASFPSGWFVFASHTIQIITQKISATFQLILYFLTPINFNILGFSLSDLGTIATMFIITLYIFCYVMIGILIYKIVSPFSGVG